MVDRVRVKVEIVDPFNKWVSLVRVRVRFEVS